jgi:hypothetical protein
MTSAAERLARAYAELRPVLQDLPPALAKRIAEAEDDEAVEALIATILEELFRQDAPGPKPTTGGKRDDDRHTA